jgi:hypothetical protein
MNHVTRKGESVWKITFGILAENKLSVEESRLNFSKMHSCSREAPCTENQELGLSKDRTRANLQGQGAHPMVPRGKNLSQKQTNWLQMIP